MVDSTIVIGAGALILHYLLSLLGWLIFKKADLFVGRLITLAAFAALAWALDQRLHKQKQKKPMAFTPRMKRLYACLAVICLAGSLILWALGVPPYPLFIAVPYLALAAGYLMQPVENRINEGFKNQARAILKQRDDLIKIGITGSYGKTSTKFILAAILSERFRVLATPASFNTPMGLTRVIREQLDNTHQIFLAEMGARHVGDIRELVDLVHPTIGLITSVGPQHLETFHDIEIVANTKFELIEGVTEANGMAFFSMDNGWVSKLYDRATCKKFAAGLQGTNLDMRADDITVGPSGSQFILRNAFGETVKCTTRLLGRHNIQNIVLASCCAEKLGMSMPEIARGIARIKPVEHRLPAHPLLERHHHHRRRLQLQPIRRKGRHGGARGLPGQAHRHHPRHGRAGRGRGRNQPRVRPSDGPGGERRHPGGQKAQRTHPCGPDRGRHARGQHLRGRLPGGGDGHPGQGQRAGRRGAV